MAVLTRTLIRMSLATQRHGWRGAIRFWTVVGLALAIGTLALVSLDAGRAVKTDLLGGALTAWTLVLALGPVFGGGGRGIRPEHFALLPIPPRRLAIGLLGAALVGAGPLAGLLAFASLAVYGFTLGAGPGLAGIVATLLQWLLAVLLARLVHGLMGAAMQTRLGMELVGFQFGLLFALLSVGWFVIQPVVLQTHQLLTEGWPPLLSSLLRALPTGWGVSAVDAAARGAWGVTLAALAGLIVLIAVLLAGWGELLVQRARSRSTGYTLRSGAPARLFRRLPATPLGAVIAKELLSWSRDPWRALEVRVAAWTGLLVGVIPLLIGWRDILPFVGMVVVVMGGAVSANLYALDGSALWQTLLTPGAARHDVRGRQIAWLLLFGPLALGATVIFTALSGASWAWPLVLSLTLATLGGAAGLMVYFAVNFPSPGVDPHLRRNPMDSSGETTGEAFAMLFLVSLTAVPALAVVLQGMASESAALQWAAVPVALLTGGLLAWGLGRVAADRLERTGPELLSRLQKGATPQAPGERTVSVLDRAWKALPASKRLVVRLCYGIAWLPLFPQGLAPLVFKLAGLDVKSWFLALYLPAEYQWPVILGMIALGVVLMAIPTAILRQAVQDQRRRDRAAAEQQYRWSPENLLEGGE